MFGDPLESQRLKFLCLQDGHSGEDAFVASTYKGIVQSLALEASEAIRLNQEVVKITTSPRTDDTEAVTVETKAGLVEAFDEVIMTCPIGWLQRNKDVFNPTMMRIPAVPHHSWPPSGSTILLLMEAIPVYELRRTMRRKTLEC